MSDTKPANKSVRIDAAGKPFIEGFRCSECGAAFTEQTMACRACGSRTPPAPFAAGDTGTLWSWSVVERSYPGVKVPFVSAIIDLDSGLTLKGTVIGADPAGLRQGRPLRLVFDDAGGARDKDGAAYVGYHFILLGDA
ncbi:MAG: OB-fold domain-containing protein [Sphingomonadales bacterium]|nr:OB-fold domain-containing protein [Sphingomonadales bacterium]